MTSLKDTFSTLKQALKGMNDEDKQETLNRLAELSDSAKKSGQKAMLSSLKLQYDWTIKEIEEIIPAGYDTFINIEDISDAINKLQEEHIRRLLLTNVNNYMHSIPEENAEKIADAQKYFDEIMILHTDFSGKDREETDKVRVEKDPIAFGVLTNEAGRKTIQNPHYYFITDWEDEYCDLTLSRLIDEYKTATDKTLNVQEAKEALNVIFTELPEE